MSAGLVVDALQVLVPLESYSDRRLAVVDALGSLVLLLEKLQVVSFDPV